jgi:large subunit ribosomal protein L18
MKSKKIKLRAQRHKRIRARMYGTAERPRVTVFKSPRHIFVQAVDDMLGKTIASVSDLKDATKLAYGKLADDAPRGSKERIAYVLGIRIADILKKKNIERGVFDRGGFLYHGRIKAVADGLRKGGMKI